MIFNQNELSAIQTISQISKIFINEMSMNHLCGTHTLMIIFMRNVSSITPKMEICYQFHPAGDAGRVMTFKKKIKIKR